MSTCIDANRALDFVDGRLTVAEEGMVEAHIADCDDCRGMIAQLAEAAAGDEADEVETIGRYQIAETLGSGGMGIVYRAYDPDLKRDVAIKLLHVGGGGRDTEAARARLLREAQGLAQLAHPNVVAVHDVGVHAGDVFVAMELVRGKTLNEWLAAKPTSAAILDTFVAAGRGLEAAHAQGLVHRDFKPDNVMIGDDGRVRVLDFGLVLPTGHRDSASDADRGPDTDSSLTQTGFVVGTPAYMAPEQHLDRDIDHRCDQFSFCVALYEALFDQAPFAGRSSRERAREVIDGNLRQPIKGSDAGLHVRNAVLRGLSRRPDDRHESMTGLLAILARPPRRPLRWLAAGAAVVAIAGAALVIGMRSADDHEYTPPAAKPAGAELCGGGDVRLRGVWDTDVRSAINNKFGQSKRPGAPLAFANAARFLDRYRTDWLRMRTASCKATRVFRTQSVDLMDRRTQCLEQRLLQLRGLTRFLSTATDKAIDNADTLVRSLASIDSCADPRVLEQQPALPDDLKTIEAVRELYVTIGVAAHQITAGDYRGALSNAIKVAKGARAARFKPLLAQAHHVMGEAQQRVSLLPGAEKSFMQAAHLAAETKNDELAAIVWANLILIKGRQYKLADALRMEPMARAAVTRAGNKPRARANLLNNLAAVHLVNGDADKALELFEKALALQVKVYGENARPVAATLVNLATTYQNKDRLGDAVKAIDRAAAIVRKVLGEDHPYMAQVMYTVGRIHEARGQDEAATDAYRRSRMIRERVMGASHPLVAAVMERQAGVLTRQGKLEKAHGLLTRALAIKTRALGNEHPLVANVLEQLGVVFGDQGKHAKSFASHVRALKIRARAFGESSPNILRSLIYVAEAAQRTGKRRRALEHFERALTILDAKKRYPLVTARVQFALARLLYPKRDRRRAVKLAQQARRAYASAGKSAKDKLADVDAWLRRNGIPIAN